MRKGLYKTFIPQTGDNGGVFFPALESNFEKIDKHTHDNIDSAAIPSTNVLLIKATLSGVWEEYGSGYRQKVQVPAGKKYSDFIVLFKDLEGDQLFLDTEKDPDDLTKYYVLSNDSELEAVAHYLS